MKREKYGTEWIPVKSYKKGLKFLEVKAVKDITDHLLKLEKVFFTVANACLFQCFSVFSVHEGL